MEGFKGWKDDRITRNPFSNRYHFLKGRAGQSVKMYPALFMVLHRRIKKREGQLPSLKNSFSRLFPVRQWETEPLRWLVFRFFATRPLTGWTLLVFLRIGPSCVALYLLPPLTLDGVQSRHYLHFMTIPHSTDSCMTGSGICILQPLLPCTTAWQGLGSSTFCKCKDTKNFPQTIFQ